MGTVNTNSNYPYEREKDNYIITPPDPVTVFGGGSQVHCSGLPSTTRLHGAAPFTTPKSHVFHAQS